MNGESWRADNPGQLRERIEFFRKHLEEQNVWPICWKAFPYKDPRSLDQNALINCAYADISQSTEEGVVDVRRRCKLHFGVPILRAHDEEFRGVYDKIVRPHAYEDKLSIMDFLPVTSRMKKPQASEYLDTLFREHAGVRFQERKVA